MKKNIVLIIAILISMLMATCAFAAKWENTDKGVRYMFDDGTYARGGWHNDTETHCRYLFNGEGYAVTGWWTPATESGIWYYFAPKNNSYGLPEGALVGNTTVEGCKLAADGLWTNPLKLKLTVDANTKKKLDEIGWDLKKAFDYCSTKIPYLWEGSSASDGTNFFAEMGFINGYGNCYTMAAMFCKMAQALGYQARQMYGSVPNKEGKLTPHSWCELIIDGKTRVFDPDFTYETKKNGYNINYGDKGTWVYQNYAEMPQ